ncbi:MAG TPA: ABC transporter substrate-binding protein [Bryobacteraceae bacterium]|nr:ABC transporter substrate-binding protein [Bryobacteraceae bacterium]
MAAVLSLLALTQTAGAAGRPRYGGTLRVEMRATVAALDPTEPGDAGSRLMPLVFDCLVQIDGQGRPRPALAVSWTHDPDHRRWRFRLRPGVRFHDGSVLTAGPAIAAALTAALPGYTVTAAADALAIECPRPTPGLLLELGRLGYIYSRSAEGVPTGTGPFRLAALERGRRAVFTANQEYWGGRPFLDSIEVSMGRSPREQWIDLEVGKADLVELAPADVRRAADRDRAVWSSAPNILLAIVFYDGRPADTRVREALARSIDRAAIHNVLLQRRGEIAGGLLPQWLSGWEFLFPSAPDLPRARQLAAALPPSGRTASLAYDAGDPLARAIAERISLNARDAGLTVHAVPGNARADARLALLPVASLDPAQALPDLAAALGYKNWPRQDRPEDVCGSERTLLEGGRVVPLFHLPEDYGVSPRVRVWQPPAIGRLGGWRLADVWLDGDRQ